MFRSAGTLSRNLAGWDSTVCADTGMLNRTPTFNSNGLISVPVKCSCKSIRTCVQQVCRVGFQPNFQREIHGMFSDLPSSEAHAQKTLFHEQAHHIGLQLSIRNCSAATPSILDPLECQLLLQRQTVELEANTWFGCLSAGVFLEIGTTQDC